MFSSPLTIIDCGASRTALGIFRRTGGRLRLEQAALERFSAPAGGEDNWLRQTAAALKALHARVKPAGRVVCVLPPHLTLTKHIRTPRVSPAKRDKIVRFEAAQGIPYNLAEVAWDTVVAGEGAADMDLLLAAAKLDAVGALSAAASAAGFEPTAMLPSALATLGAVRAPAPARGGPALVLNLGARSTVLLHVEPDRFASRTVAIGGSGLPDRPAAEALETFATRVAQEVTRSVLHFNRLGGIQKPVRLLLTGGASRVDGLAGALAGRVGLPVEQLDSSGIVDVAPAARAGAALLGEALNDLAGAAAGRLLATQPALNLLPARLRRQAGIRRRRAWLMAAAACATLAALPPLWHTRTLEQSARAKTAAIEAAIAPVREREARNRAALAELEELRREAAVLQDLQARRTAWQGLLSDLQGRLVTVEDVWFERMQTLPPAAGAPLKLAVSGRMLDKTNPLAKVSPETFSRVQALLAGLADSPFVAAVEGERFDNSQPGILRFDFVLVTDGAHPL